MAAYRRKKEKRLPSKPVPNRQRKRARFLQDTTKRNPLKASARPDEPGALDSKGKRAYGAPPLRFSTEVRYRKAAAVLNDFEPLRGDIRPSCFLPLTFVQQKCNREVRNGPNRAVPGRNSKAQKPLRYMTI
jgi:hypothetical protein